MTPKVKELVKDPDALVLIALAVLLVLIPDAMFEQVKERTADGLVQTILAVAFGGRMVVRGAGALGVGVNRKGWSE